MGKTFKVMVVGEPGVLGMSSGSISSYPVTTEIWRKVYKGHVMEIHDTHYGSARATNRTQSLVALSVRY
ncbi:hypothetical protein DL95DRAFT_472101 [Leptodontidium sp. 2 PMI_412]|nr:hypothetical protein DL95DRAFT_472101 [Leptodontidium sp. 2 PMI_412]